MTKISKQLLNKVGASLASSNPKVVVEKVSASSDGSHAQVLFRLATTNARAKEVIKNGSVFASFSDAVNGEARLIPGTLVAASDNDNGLYFGCVALNIPMMTLSSAKTAGFRMVSANLFADSDDNIWSVSESAEGEKILSRSVSEDLSQLLKTRVMPASMSTAAAGVQVGASFKGGQVCAFYDAKSETMRKGVTVDNTTAFDFEGSRFFSVQACDLLVTSPVNESIASGLDAAFGDRNATFEERASSDPALRENIRRFLTALYSSNKEYLNTYLSTIDRLIVA